MCFVAERGKGLLLAEWPGEGADDRASQALGEGKLATHRCTVVPRLNCGQVA